MNKSITGKALVALLALIAVFAAMTHRIPDLAWVGLKLGEHLARQHSSAPPGLFSFLPVSSDWWETSWLWNLVSCMLYKNSGIIGLRITVGLLALLLTIFIYKLVSDTKPIIIPMILSFPILMSLKESLAFQPMFASVLFFSAQIILIEKRKIHPAAFFFLYLVWAQTDNAVVVGLTWLLIWLALEKSLTRRRRILLALSAFIGALPSPTMLHFITRPSSIAVIFQATPDFHNIFNQFQALLVLSGILGAAYLKEHSGRVLALLALTVFGLMAGEYFPLAVVTAAPIILAAVNRLGEELRPSRVLSGGIAILMILTSVKLLAPQRSYLNSNEDKLFSFLGDHKIVGWIYSPWQMSGRVSFVTGKKIAIDGRPGLYRGEAAGIYAELSRMDSPTWDETARNLGISGVIVSNLKPDYRFMAMKPDWALAFEEGDWAFFVRDAELNVSLLDRWGRKKPRVAEKGTPDEMARQMKESAKDWLKKGNPYRARWALLAILSRNPTDTEAQRSLEAVERQIRKAGSRQ